MRLNDNHVAINFTGIGRYPQGPLFHPAEAFPEYEGEDLDPANKVYGEVRRTLYLMGLDRENFGTPKWNPLGGIIEPGMTVFLKPNLVRHHHLLKKDLFSIIVHGSVVRPILDYILKALQGEGKVICGLAQVIFGDFEKAMLYSGIGPMLDWQRRRQAIEIQSFDTRYVRGARTWLYGKWARPEVKEDPLGYQWVDLGDLSHFKDIDASRLRIAIGSYKNMYKHHSNGRHEIMFPKSVLSCDALVSVPKLKTHRRTAVTMAIKNNFGLPAWKETLPHWVCGSPEEGGDQYIYPSKRKAFGTHLHDMIQSNPYVPVKCAAAILKKIVWNSQYIIPFKDPVYEAMWWGNDTLWRTQLDINRAFFYADKNGVLQDKPQHRYFVFVDGLTAGENDGPNANDPLYPGVLTCGFNPVMHDAVGATLMGFDIDKIKVIKNGLTLEHPKPLFTGNPWDWNVTVRDEDDTVGQYDMEGFKAKYNLKFKAQENWRGHIERQ
jgi:uncharacterized protein (DUF362 family)